MRHALLVAVAAAGLAAAAVATAPTNSTASALSPERTVPCSEITLRTKFPYLGGYAKKHRYRLVLDAVSVPPAHMEQIVATGETAWPYFRKQGMVVRGDGVQVTISVPRAWRNRLGVSWGNAGHGVMSSLRINGCGTDPTRGNAYAGGFFIRSRAACVPLVFKVGSRSATVRFGLGRPCTS